MSVADERVIPSDPWRLACPREHHRSLRYTNRGPVYCKKCEEFFNRVKDLKRDRLVKP